jgi:hypothetical protein
VHRIADPLERKSSSKISEKIGAKQGKAQPPALRENITFSKLGSEGPSTRRTPLSTSPTEKWRRITRRKEANEAKGRQAALSVPPSSKEDRKKIVVTAAPFYPDVLFIGGRVESNPISDDEPTAQGEEPLHRESRRRRNRRRNIRRHHEAGERDPAQPMSRDEVLEVGETPEEWALRERRNSRRRDRRQAQEQAEQEARQHRENPLFGRNLNPDFARAMNTSSEVSGVLARIAYGLPRTLRHRGLSAAVHSSSQPPSTPRSSAKRSMTCHQQPAGRTELYQRFARTTTRERDSSPGRVRSGSRHPNTESGHQDRVGHNFNWWHHPGTVKAPRQPLPSPGKTSSPTTRRQLWSIGAYSTPQGHSMAP